MSRQENRRGHGGFPENGVAVLIDGIWPRDSHFSSREGLRERRIRHVGGCFDCRYHGRAGVLVMLLRVGESGAMGGRQSRSAEELVAEA
jgi:hypothetical protein